MYYCLQLTSKSGLVTDYYRYKMENEDSLHRCFTKFMLETCRRPNNDYNGVGRFIRFCSSVTRNNSFDEFEMFTSGSSAELYIKPMLSCFGDIDVMQFSKKNYWRFRTDTDLPWHYRSVITRSLSCLKSSTVMSRDMFV